MATSPLNLPAEPAERIRCKTPSTGKIINLTIPRTGMLTIDASTTPRSDNAEWEIFAQAPEFSVPDPRRQYPNRDTDDSRAIRPGELFFMTPVFVRNTNDINTDPIVIEVEFVHEFGMRVACPGRMVIPGGDTAMVPVQGRSLVKRDPENFHGDCLRIKAYGPGLELWASVEIKPSAEHTLEPTDA